MLDLLHTSLENGSSSLCLGLESIQRKRSSCWHLGRVRSNRMKLLHGNTATLDHFLLGCTDPNTGVIELLVGLVGSGGVANLALKVIVLGSFELTKAIPVGPLSVGVNVHLDNTVPDSLGNFLICRTGSAVHNEENGLVTVDAELFLGVSLVLSEARGLESDIARLVDTVDISESGGNGEHGSNFGELLVHSKDLFGAGVELFGIDSLVVDTILFSSGDSNLHLEPDLHVSHFFKVLGADGNVLIIGFLGKIEHVRGKEGFAVLCKVGFVGLEHTIEPRQELLGTMVRVENNGDTVVRGNSPDVEGHSHGTSRSVVGILNSFAREKGGSAIRALDDHRTIVFLGGFQGRIARGRTNRENNTQKG